MNEYHKGALMHISAVLGHVYHVAGQRVLFKLDFLDIYLTTFSEAVISEIKIYQRHLPFRNI